ncbi:hypothetical protein E4U43_006956 [Claviceps pusilla]|uniref:FMP25 Found in Mitochondrial Proteome n=1 Tax=Claviceps pusilla TaxID=123648 RepID=A0A9P7T1Z5_9HYPO|nr:hypothetical protein E4U43_006956 [Claviceps pusilla]
MNPSKVVARRTGVLTWSSRSQIHPPRPRLQWTRHASNGQQEQAQKSQQGGSRSAQLALYAGVFGIAAAGAYYYPRIQQSFSTPEESAPSPKASQLKFEKARKQTTSKEDYRDLLSSQHLQVKTSWERPGVYAWGSNAGKVIDPHSSEKYIKLPRRIPGFENQLLRDLKLTQSFGAAIDETGNLIQWGLGFSKDDPTPAITLKGKDLVKLQVSQDRVITLSRNGSVYSLPSSKEDLDNGAKQKQQGGGGLWSLWSNGSGSNEAISFRNLTPAGLNRGEKVTDISSGLEHCLILTSKGRVFTAASSSTSYPSRGQMGIAGLTWGTRPKGPYDQPHELKSLQGFEAKAIATGDHHSVILDKLGRIFSFGDNTFGQLGSESAGGLPYITTPLMMSVDKLYAAAGMVPKVTAIAAGGANTFFTVDADAPTTAAESRAMVPAKRMPRTRSDLWACGQGVMGTLGTGKWTHVSSGPTKVKALSSLFEFDESTNKNMPIKLKALSIGSTHCAAVMDNVTKTNVTSSGSENETNWGADVLFWGGNEHYQLGTGKRTNLCTPTYIGPLDGGSSDADKGRKTEVHRLCLTPRQTVRIGEGGQGRKVTLEQKVECGKYVTGIYSAV